MRRGKEEKWGSSKLASGRAGEEIDLGFKDGKKKLANSLLTIPTESLL